MATNRFVYYGPESSGDYDTFEEAWQVYDNNDAQGAVYEQVHPPLRICILCGGRGWQINVPSQDMYPCRNCKGAGKVTSR